MIEQIPSPYGEAFDRARYEQWEDLFFKVQTIVTPYFSKEHGYWVHTMDIVRDLGRMDARLVVGDAWIASLAGDVEKYDEAEFQVREHATLSRLWLLGAYELMRVIVSTMRKLHEANDAAYKKLLEADEEPRNRAGRVISPPVQHPHFLKFQGVLHRLTRFRIPLAKLEPADKYKKEGDGRIARTALSEGGLGWTVSDTVFANRKDLADEVIGVIGSFDAFPNRPWRGENGRGKEKSASPAV